MKRKIVLFDMDGVLCDYTEKLLTLAHERFGLPLYRQEEVGSFNTESIFPEEYQERVGSLSCERGFYESLKPVPFAIDAFHQIVNQCSNGEAIDVFICTAPKRFENNQHCLAEKSAWVAKYLGKQFVDRIIFTRDKTLVHGHVLIDDKPVITGTRIPNWIHVYYDRPYNQPYDIPRIKSWKQWKETLLPLLLVS